MKATNDKITPEMLEKRYEHAKAVGFDSKAKWIEFSEILLEKGYILYLYEARRTYSKYISITKEGTKKRRRFVVRFSNHKPIYEREINNDCDFFVGVTNLSVTTTKDALKAVEKFFNE